MNNRLHNCKNPWQGEAKKVLCVCSAGLLRSPTAAVVLQREFGFNTRAAGIEESFALVPVDKVLLTWADEIVCMDAYQQAELEQALGEDETPVISLDIEDSHGYMDEVLQAKILEAYMK